MGIRPLVVLIPRHTYVGYWTSAREHERFWRRREGKLWTGKFGESWTITNGDELAQLVSQGAVALIEATYLCKPDKTFAAACQSRADEFQKADKDCLDVAIAIYAARWAVQPV